MKLLSLAVVLLTSPLINALALDNNNGGQGMLNSYLKSHKLDSRSALATSIDDICIKYCTTPASDVTGICVENQCGPPGQCMKIQGLVTADGPIGDSMANIFMAEDVTCGLWTALDCTEDGPHSTYQTHTVVADIKEHMTASAKSYRCVWKGQNRRSVSKQPESRVVEERAAPGVTALKSRIPAQKEISRRVPCIRVDWSNSPDSEQYGENLTGCYEPLVLYIINRPLPGGMASIHFDDGFACDVWTNSACIDLGRKSHAFITKSMSDITPLLKEGVNDGRAKCFSCRSNPPHAAEVQKNSTAIRIDAVEEREAPPVVQSTEVTETSNRTPDTCIGFCNQPDSFQFRHCYLKNCASSGQCMNINSQVLSGMGSIDFADGIVCDVYRAFDCKVDGRNSHIQIQGGIHDLEDLLQGLGHSYKCELANNSATSNKAIETREEEPLSVEARMKGRVSRSSLTSRGESGTCVDNCSEHDFKGSPTAVAAPEVEKRVYIPVTGTCVDFCWSAFIEDASCTRNYCTDANICVTPPLGVNAIGFGGAGYCLIYPTKNCREDPSNLTFSVEETSSDLSGISGWKGEKSKPKSFMCARYVKKREVQPVEVQPVEVQPVEVQPVEVAKREEFGACIDHCTGSNFTGDCTRNRCMEASDCISVSDSGIGSIGFGGATHCTLYLLDNCKSSGSAPLTIIKEPTSDVKAFAGWTLNTAKSFRCSRPYKKRDIQFIDATPAAAAAAELATRNVATPAFGTCVDYCTGADFTGECQKNVCTKDLECFNVGIDGFDSIKFSGNTYCWIYIDEYCDPEWVLLSGKSVLDVGIEMGSKPTGAASFKCRRVS